MADVSIKYKGNTIAEMSGGSKTLNTSGMYCEDDITVEHTPNCKQFYFTNSTAVATKYTTVVTGDADVAAHYADTNAMVIIHKITNTMTNGICFACAGNILNGTNYGVYSGYNASSNSTSSSLIGDPISQQTDSTAGIVHIMCTPAGDIRIMCNRQQTNFGGASYRITFSW